MISGAHDAVVIFPAMAVGVYVRGEQIAQISYLPLPGPVVTPRSRLAERAVEQLRRYREDPDYRFDLPLMIEGSAFQRRVWNALCTIPRGRTLRYGELAGRLNSGPRAVGQACGANRFPVVVPCHRVVAANGIGGFAHQRDGFLIEAKKWLLEHERAL